MDYHSIHGHDVSSFDLPSTRKYLRFQLSFGRRKLLDVTCHLPAKSLTRFSPDRLPTVSAAKALEDFQCNNQNYVSTGLTSLDAMLGSVLGDGSVGGIQKGHVTEIWGPPGAGKTALGYVCVK
jgi:hypothetical protein